MKIIKHLVVFAMLGLSAIAATAQTFTPLHDFTNTPDGASSWSSLALAGNTLFGTTSAGGLNGPGVVFALNTSDGGYTNLYSFGNAAADGLQPWGGLALAGNTLFGTTQYGGTNGNGEIFKIGTNGTGYVVLRSFAVGNEDASFNFTNSDGANPYASLLLSGNMLFGTTQVGGTNGNGTVFKMNTNGTGFTVLRTFSIGNYDASFNFTNSNGANPAANLIISGNMLYGAARHGGTNGSGTLFAMNTNGTGYTVIKTFSALDQSSFPGTNNDGDRPIGGLVLSGNMLYGTTADGGTNGNGTLFRVNTNGTGFTVLWSFSALDPTSNTNNDGANPVAGLILSSNTLYGTAEAGGSNSYGTLFKIGTNGTGFAVLQSFDSSDAMPGASLIISSNTLYGTTSGGNAGGLGNVFSFSLTIRPYFNLLLMSNRVPQIGVTGGTGQSVQIQVATNLPATWATLTNLVLTNGTGQFKDSAATNFPKRFYRALAQ